MGPQRAPSALATPERTSQPSAGSSKSARCLAPSADVTSTPPGPISMCAALPRRAMPANCASSQLAIAVFGVPDNVSREGAHERRFLARFFAA